MSWLGAVGLVAGGVALGVLVCALVFIYAMKDVFR